LPTLQKSSGFSGRKVCFGVRTFFHKNQTSLYKKLPKVVKRKSLLYSSGPFLPGQSGQFYYRGGPGHAKPAVFPGSPDEGRSPQGSAQGMEVGKSGQHILINQAVPMAADPCASRYPKCQSGFRPGLRLNPGVVKLVAF
jgi:hypothetical protein